LRQLLHRAAAGVEAADGLLEAGQRLGQLLDVLLQLLVQVLQSSEYSEDNGASVEGRGSDNGAAISGTLLWWTRWAVGGGVGGDGWASREYPPPHPSYNAYDAASSIHSTPIHSPGRGRRHWSAARGSTRRGS
jgi:hypothetical protein